MNKTVKGTSLVAGGILLGAIGVTAFRFLIEMRNNKIALREDDLGGSVSVSPFGVGEEDTLGGFSDLSDFSGFSGVGGSASVSPFGVGEEDTLGDFDDFGAVLPSDVSYVGEYGEDFGENDEPENLDSLSSLDSSDWRVTSNSSESKPFTGIVSGWNGNLGLEDFCEEDYEEYYDEEEEHDIEEYEDEYSDEGDTEEYDEYSEEDEDEDEYYTEEDEHDIDEYEDEYSGEGDEEDDNDCSEEYEDE